MNKNLSIDAINKLPLAQREKLKALLEKKGIDFLTLPVFKRPPDLTHIPHSYAQERLWVHDQFEPGRSFYNIASAVRLSGQINHAALCGALNEMVRRHESLRTTFSTVDGKPGQVIAPVLRVELPVTDLGGLPAGEREARAQWLIQDEANTPFNLTCGPLLRAVLLRMDDSHHILLLTLHHIVSDAWSMGVIVEEMAALYGAQVHGQPSPLPELAIQYPDYSHWQREWLRGPTLDAQLKYWKKQLDGAPELLALPTDRPRPPRQSYRGTRARFTVPATVCAGLHQIGKQFQVTLFMTLAAAFNVLLSRYSGQSDLCIGTTVAGRGRIETEPMIGFFANTLVLRSQVDAAASFDTLLRQVRGTALDAHANQDLAFQQLVDCLKPERNLSYTPIFQVMLVLLNTPMGDLELSGLTLQPMVADLASSKFDLTLYFSEEGDELSAGFEYRTDLFDASTIERMVNHFGRLLSSIAAHPSARIADLEMLDRAERQQLLLDWNTNTAAAAVAPAAHRCVHQLFEEQAARDPSAVALVHGDRAVSYGELNAQANRLAHHLRGLGVGPDTRVAICVERGVGMMVAVLATLKAGGGYVPLDPAYPQDRLAYMLADSAPQAVLVDGAGQAALAGVADSVGDAPRIDLAQDAAWQDNSDANPQVAGLGPAQLAYIIYTSGSTGAPKGVMIEHANVVRLFSATDAWFSFGADDVWTLFHSFAFDFSVWEMWGALAHGGQLVIVPLSVARAPDEFYQLLCRRGVTVLNQTPTAFRQLIAAQGLSQAAHRLRYTVFGGEALETSLLAPWYARAVNAGTQLINMYGITETTVHVTYRPLEPADAARHGASPIGRRIPDLRTYILDANRQPVPIGVVGELYVGGAGVARGYLNRPELTAERFLDDPFAGEAGARMYKTGDLGRFLADGSIDYLGRNDFQVKIRGFRIELGEIEARLSACAGVREAVVLAREDQPGDKRLVAYIVAQAGAEPEAGQLRLELGCTLSDYMVPSAFVTLDAFPLTPNGKLDQKALPAPDGDAYARRGYEAPEGETEEGLAEIWRELFKLEQVGRHDNFFELGGHSLLAVALIERMRQVGMQIDVRTLFGTPTIAALATALGTGEADVTVPPNGIAAGCAAITPAMLPLTHLTQHEIDGITNLVPGGAANIQDIYPLAPLQAGILFHHMIQGAGDAYLLPTLIEFDSLERLNGFLSNLQTVIDRHDILRTAVMWEGLAEPHQVVLRHAPLNIEQVEFDPAGGAIADQMSSRYDPRGYRMDVRQAPLMRGFMTEDRDNGRWLLQFLAHHLAIDHTTMEILVEEIRTIQLGREAELPRALPFRNFIAQARLGVSRAEHEAFFTQMLADIDEPTLPYGLLDVRGDGSRIREIEQQLPSALALQLRAQARAQGVSVASLMHLAWAQVLARLSGRRDVVFGTVLFGRMQGGAGSDR
ncbi:amino acid adenylation domain-containing protein, partial [Duganella violaceipulchra]